MAAVTLAKAERMEKTIEKQRDKLREGARIGTSAVITSLGGGVLSGYLYKKYPTIGNTSLNSSGTVGMLLVFAALSGVAEEFSDELAALGSGMLASTVSREAENYFDP